MPQGRQSSPNQGPSMPQEQQGRRLWRGFRLVWIPRSLALLLHEDHQELLRRLTQLEKLIMATKDEVNAAVKVLGDKIDAFIASHTGQTAEEIQKLLDDQKAALMAEDATMDAKDFDDISAAIMAIANRVPPKFEASGQGG